MEKEISLSTSWLNGKYEIEDYNVEINTALSYVSIDNNEDENESYYFQGDEANDVIKEIFNIWKNKDMCLENAIYEFIIYYL